MTFDIVSSLHVCVPLSASVVSSVLPLCYLTCCSISSVPHLSSVSVYIVFVFSCVGQFVVCVMCSLKFLVFPPVSSMVC